MAVITISRQFGSHGDTVAQLLCDRLGYRCFDKNLMLGLAAAAGAAASAQEQSSAVQVKQLIRAAHAEGNVVVAG